MANYGATKAYILSLGEALNVEWGPQGIDVTVLSPGLTVTDMPAAMPFDFSKDIAYRFSRKPEFWPSSPTPG